MLDHGYSSQLVRLGIPDRFIEHGEQKELYDECYFDTNAIKQSVRVLMEKSKVGV
jgi:1-deoxy-D-xylulose-5-phosphate synthase